MKKYLAIAAVLLAVAGMAVADDLTGTAGWMGQEDIYYGTGQYAIDGTTTSDSFTYDGNTFSKIPNPNATSHSVIKSVWYVSADTGITDHSATGTAGSLAWVEALVDDPGVETHVVLPGNRNYVISDNLEIDADVVVEFQPGAVLDIASGKTVTFNGPILAPENLQIFSLDTSATVRPVAFVAGSVSQIEAGWFMSGSETGDDMAYAFEAAIASAGNKGIPIHVSAGDYSSSMITIGDFGPCAPTPCTTVNNVTLLLDEEAVIDLKDGSNEDLLVIDASNVLIVGGQLDGRRKYNTAGSCLVMDTGEADITIRGMEIYECDENGMDLVGTRIFVEDVYVHDVDDDCIYGAACIDCRITDCDIKDPDDDGIELVTGSVNSYIAGNTLTDIADDGIIVSSQYARVIKNSVTFDGGSSQRGIALDQSSGGDRSSVANNLVRAAEPGTTVGISLEDVLGGSVTGNAVSLTSRGIALHSAQRWAVTGNQLRAADYGVHFDQAASGTTRDNTVAGNTIITTAASSIGVYVHSNHATGLIQNNIVANNAITNGGSMADGILLFNEANTMGALGGLHNNIVRGNTIFSPGDDGIEVDNDSGDANNDVLDHNTILGAGDKDYEFTNLGAASELICNPTTPVWARFVPNGAQTYAVDGTAYEIDYEAGSETESEDFASVEHMEQTGTGTNWKVTAQRPITVRVSASAAFDDATFDAGDTVVLELFKDTTQIRTLDTWMSAVSAVTDSCQVSGTTVIDLDKDEYIQVKSTVTGIAPGAVTRDDLWAFEIEEVN